MAYTDPDTFASAAMSDDKRRKTRQGGGKGTAKRSSATSAAHIGPPNPKVPAGGRRPGRPASSDDSNSPKRPGRADQSHQRASHRARVVTAHALSALSWTTKAILAAAIALVVGGVYALLTAHDSTPPSLAAQWDSVRADISRGHWEISDTRIEDLRGDGSPVTIFVLRQPIESVAQCAGPHASPSDEIRIYGVTDGRVRLAYQFQPPGHGCTNWLFTIMTFKDLLQQGHPDLIGQFSEGGRGIPIVVPVVLSWDDSVQRFRLIAPLQSPPTDLSPQPGTAIAFFRKAVYVYSHRIRLGATEASYAVADFALSNLPAAGPLLLAQYDLTNPRDNSVLYERAAWLLQVSGQRLVAGACDVKPTVRDVRVPAAADPDLLLRKLQPHGSDIIAASGCAA
jgi:hypothetical protein